MKRIHNSGLLIVLLFCSEAYSQTEPVYILNSQKEVDRATFICAEMKYTRIIGSWESMAGVRFGYCINHAYIFGLEVHSILSDNSYLGSGAFGTETTINNAMVYGGFYFDYVVPTNYPIQLSFPTLIGAGECLLYEKFDNTTQRDAEILELDGILVIEPKINIELNLSSFIRIGIGCGYRIVGKTDLSSLENSDLSGFLVNANIKFGGF